MTSLKRIGEALGFKFLGKELALFIVCILICVYSIVFSYFSILRHNAFRSYAWDLGIFSQSLWTTLDKGTFFSHNLELFLNPTGSFFAVHFSPVLFLVLPVYALLPLPETLLVLQSIVLGLGALPLYFLIKEKSQNILLGFILVLSYLAYPALHGINWFDFHLQSFFPLFIFTALYYYEKENWNGYLAFLMLTLMVEEQVAIILIFWGIYLTWISRKRIWQFLTEKNILNATIFVPLLSIMIPLAWLAVTRHVKATMFPINPTYLREYKALWNWSVLGIENDPLLLPAYALLNPGKALDALYFDFPLKFLFIIFIFAPLAFLPLTTLSVIISFAWLVPVLLSNNHFYYTLGYQYPAYIIPFLFYATIQAINKISKNDVNLALRVSKTLPVILLIFLISLSPISPFPKIFSSEYSPPRITPHETLLHEIISLIPNNASVLTQNNIFPHISSRSNAYAVFPHAALLPLKKQIYDFTTNITHNVEYILVDLTRDFLAFDYALARAETENYGVYAYAGKIVLFKLNYSSAPLIFEPLSEFHDCSTLKVSHGSVIEDDSSESGRVMFHSVEDESSKFFWFGPYTPLPPGNYTAILRLKVDDIGSGSILTIDVVKNGGNMTIAYKTIDLGEFRYQNLWQDFTLDFALKKSAYDIEIRGMINSNFANIYLDNLEIAQNP